MQQKITFKNASGINLSARLELPTDQKPYAYAIFAHCFTCNKNLTAVRNISRALTQNGFGVLRFDFTGLGESEGDFADSNFSSNISDIVDAANYMAEELKAPKLLIGHSLGGAAVIFAAAKIESVQAVATIGAPSSPQHVQHIFAESIDTIVSEGDALVDIGGRPFTIKKEFIEDIADRKMEQVVKDLRKPILVMHSPQDNTVGIVNAGEIYNAAMHPKSFISLDGADHLLSDKADSIYAGNVISGWAQRYIPQDEISPLKTDYKVVSQTGQDGYTTEIKAGKHSLLADEPAEVGGADFGPTPYDLLLSALGACTSMTLRMYADLKKWPLKTVRVHLNHAKDYASDCSDCEDHKSKIDKIDRTIELTGDLDDQQRKRLLQIADRCPVHKTLHNTVEVNTTEIAS